MTMEFYLKLMLSVFVLSCFGVVLSMFVNIASGFTNKVADVFVYGFGALFLASIFGFICAGIYVSWSST